LPFEFSFKKIKD